MYDHARVFSGMCCVVTSARTRSPASRMAFACALYTCSKDGFGGDEEVDEEEEGARLSDLLTTTLLN